MYSFADVGILPVDCSIRHWTDQRVSGLGSVGGVVHSLRGLAAALLAGTVANYYTDRGPCSYLSLQKGS